jgi:hypothetical protein
MANHVARDVAVKKLKKIVLSFLWGVSVAVSEAGRAVVFLTVAEVSLEKLCINKGLWLYFLNVT